MSPLAILASRVRFEEKRIFAALERRGVPYVHLDTRRFVAEPGAAPPAAAGVAVGAGAGAGAGVGVGVGFGVECSFDIALNREISLSRSLYAALLLESQGVRMVNPARVIETCGDKVRTSLALAAAGLPTPRTALALTPDAALEALDRLGFPVVVKPLTGSWGRLVAVLRDRTEAETVLEHRAALPSPQQHIVYLQELIDKPDRDIRVLVTGDEVIAAAYRYGVAGWRSNAALGGRSEPCPLSDELTELARRAATAVGGGVLGVDLVEGPNGLRVLEVNHAVEFQGLQTAHGDAVDVAGAIVSHVTGAL